MFWVFILAAALAIVLIKLGMFSVWMVVLSGALQFALLVILVLAIAIVWRWVFKAKTN